MDQALIFGGFMGLGTPAQFLGYLDLLDDTTHATMKNFEKLFATDSSIIVLNSDKNASLYNEEVADILKAMSESLGEYFELVKDLKTELKRLK